MQTTFRLGYGGDMDAGVATGAEEGLRERKKRERRATIAAVALRLFDEQGFRNTTVAQIAEAADVSPRTVFAYFPTKEDLLFPDATAMVESLSRALDGREEGVTTGDALRTWMQGLLEQREDDEDDRIRRRIIESEMDLRAHEHLVMDVVGDVLAASLARDLGSAPDDVVAQLATAAAVGALNAIGRRHWDEKGASCGQHNALALELIDQAMVFVDGGTRALRDHATSHEDAAHPSD